MQRVIIWADEWYPILGGLELALHKTALALTDLDISVSVITMDDGICRETLPYEVLVIPKENWVSKCAELLNLMCRETKSFLYVGRLFKGYEIPQLSILSNLDAFRVLRIPSTWGRNRYNKKPFPELLTSCVDAFITLNDRTRCEIERRFSTKPIYFSYNWSPVIPCEKVFRERQGFFYAGRINKSKNVRNMLLAWSKFNEEYGNSLTIFADAYEQTERLCNSILLERNRDSVVVRQAYPLGQIGRLKNFEFAILPSYREGCPNILVESFSQGIPVIGTSISGIKEHIESVEGVLIKKPYDSQRILNGLKEAQLLSAVHYSALCDRSLDYHALYLAKETVAHWIFGHLNGNPTPKSSQTD